MTDHTNALRLWDAAHVQVTDVRHGLLKGQQMESTEESSAFLFVRANAGQVIVDEMPYQLKWATLFHIGRGRQLCVDARDDEAEYYLMSYQADCPQLAGREMTRLFLSESPFEACYAVCPSGVGLLADAFQRLYDAFHRANALDHLMVRQLLYTIVHAAYAERMSAKAIVPKVDVVQRARQYLETNLSQENPVLKLCGVLDISRSSLHEQFRRAMGVGPRDYLMQCRMKEACRLLCQSSLTMQEISVLCGMRDKDYFSRMFSGRMGMPPGAYRAAHLDTSDTAQAETANRPEHWRTSRAKQSVVTIENGGRIHRYAKTPERIVCLNYVTAELCAALGAADRIVGVSSTEDALSDCDAAYRDTIRQAPFLCKSARNVPSFHSVCACNPDLVVGTSYSFQSHGIAEAADFERRGIHIYALTATNILGSTFEETYEDLHNLGQILGCGQRAQALIAAMREKEARVRRCVHIKPEPIRVFAFDAIFASDRAFTCGQSLENHMIAAAGGCNVFAGQARQFAAVDWAEVAAANPQAILVHRFGDGDDGDKKLAFLQSKPELLRTDAMRNGKISIIGFKKVFPGIDNLDTVMDMAKWFGTWEEG